MKNLQRKAVQTWFVLTMAILGYAYLFQSSFPYRTLRGTWLCIHYSLYPGSDACDRKLRLRSTETITDWQPTIQIVGATTIALVLVIAYLRIWKRPDES